MTTSTKLPFGLTTRDVAKLTPAMLAIIACIVLWFNLQQIQGDYRDLAQSCVTIPVTQSNDKPQIP